MRTLRKNLCNVKNEFLNSFPFNHVVIDDFLEKDFAELLADRFPGKNDVVWWAYDNPLEKKLAYDNIENLDPAFREFFSFCNSNEFIQSLRDLTEISDLMPDPMLRGGGLHLIERGGKLDIHEDFNIHKALNAYRRLNLIFYLNKDWNASWGGNLELWNRDMTICEKSIEPSYNRAVIFRTDQNSNHGHPSPLMCPEDRSRISLAVYYYEPIKSSQIPDFRSTIYKKLPNESNQFDELREKRSQGRIEDKVSRMKNYKPTGSNS